MASHHVALHIMLVWYNVMSHTVLYNSLLCGQLQLLQVEFHKLIHKLQAIVGRVQLVCIVVNLFPVHNQSFQVSYHYQPKQLVKSLFVFEQLQLFDRFAECFERNRHAIFSFVYFKTDTRLCWARVSGDNSGLSMVTHDSHIDLSNQQCLQKLRILSYHFSCSIFDFAIGYGTLHALFATGQSFTTMAMCVPDSDVFLYIYTRFS
jgi:hypothetical protein